MDEESTKIIDNRETFQFFCDYNGIEIVLFKQSYMASPKFIQFGLRISPTAPIEYYRFEHVIMEECFYEAFRYLNFCRFYIPREASQPAVLQKIKLLRQGNIQEDQLY